MGPTSLPPEPPSDGRFLSQEQCAELARQVASLIVGGGHVQTVIESTWTGGLRFARNQVHTGSDVRDTTTLLHRTIRGASADVCGNVLDVAALAAAVARSERLLQRRSETVASELEVEYTEQHLKPNIWSNTTYTLAAEARAEVVRTLLPAVERAGMVAAGDIQVAAHGRAVMSSRGRAMYYPFTEAQYSVTVRDPQGLGSGWAGGSHYDWAKLDTQAITQRALEKCLASRNPVALEPGRYTTILEPQAVSDILSPFLFEPNRGKLDREQAENPNWPDNWIFHKTGQQSKLGDVVVDERLNVASDPMDPELGVPPFAWNQAWLEMYYPAQWIKQGVLTSLAYSLEYALARLNKSTQLQHSGSYRMWSSAPPTSIEDMIATTKRGLIVSRMYKGYTRDGLWLIENGKISKPVKNFAWEEDAYLLLQSARVEQIGTPVRVFSPGAPVVVPALKIKDFNFTRLVDAI